jgi:hypothetical protein
MMGPADVAPALVDVRAVRLETVLALTDPAQQRPRGIGEVQGDRPGRRLDGDPAQDRARGEHGEGRAE